jgi:group I intron endonuclease
MSKKYYVYVHTLKNDGRKYFGVTCQEPKDRWRNGEGYKGSTHMYNAIQKYGWNAFTHEILHVCETQKEAYDYEIYYINKYNTTDEQYGFNCHSGGPNPKRHWKSNERQSNTRKGKKYTGEAYEHILQNIQKAIEHNTGRHRSEETKQKISKAHIGMKCKEETKQRLREAASIPVLCVELNKIFPSSTEAGKYFKKSKSTINAALCGRNKTAAGYHWTYYNS